MQIYSMSKRERRDVENKTVCKDRLVLMYRSSSARVF